MLVYQRLKLFLFSFWKKARDEVEVVFNVLSGKGTEVGGGISWVVSKIFRKKNLENTLEAEKNENGTCEFLSRQKGNSSSKSHDFL